MLKYLSIVMLSLFFLLGFQEKSYAGLALGDEAPSLKVPLVEGEVFDLTKLKGKIVILHYWATWCAPCRLEMPEIAAYYKNNQSKGIVLLALSVDRRADRAKVKDIGLMFHMPVALWADVKETGFPEPDEIPATYIIDQKGVIQAIMIPEDSAVTQDNLSTVIKPLLSTPPKSQ